MLEFEMNEGLHCVSKQTNLKVSALELWSRLHWMHDVLTIVGVTNH